MERASNGQTGRDPMKRCRAVADIEVPEPLEDGKIFSGAEDSLTPSAIASV
jgi:hypothetical protein